MSPICLVHFLGTVGARRSGLYQEVIMCKDCQHTNDVTQQMMETLSKQVRGLVDALQMAPTEDYEVGDPMWCGGVKGTYALRSPFNGDCQFRVESCTAGATASVVAVSPFRSIGSIDLVGSQQSSYSENSAYPAIVSSIPASTTLITGSGWYNVVDSENCVYVVVTASSNSAGANIQFRQKR